MQRDHAELWPDCVEKSDLDSLAGIGEARSGPGAWVRDQRIRQRRSLDELSLTTRIPRRSLELIEANRFEDLPGKVFTRGFLQAYASTLGLDPSEAVQRLTQLGGTVAEPRESNPTVKSRRLRGLRFELAVPVAVCFLLFTLALAIVLRPRKESFRPEISLAVPVEPSIRTGRPVVTGPKMDALGRAWPA